MVDAEGLTADRAQCTPTATKPKAAVVGAQANAFAEHVESDVALVLAFNP